MLQNFVIAAVVLGVAAVYAVPFISGLLKGFVPAQFAGNLPSEQTPGFGTQALISVVVYGALLALVLMLFRNVGIKVPRATGA